MVRYKTRCLPAVSNTRKRQEPLRLNHPRPELLAPTRESCTLVHLADQILLVE